MATTTTKVIIFRKNRFAQMQVQQLEELARNNTLKRQIFVDLIKNSNFAAAGSKFFKLYELTQKGRTIPCFQATTCRREIKVRLADGDVTIGLSVKDSDFDLLWSRLSPLAVCQAQILGFSITHDVRVPQSLDTLATTLAAFLEGLNVAKSVTSKLISALCKLVILLQSKFDRVTAVALLIDVLVSVNIDFTVAQQIVQSISGHLKIAFQFLTNAIVAQVDQQPIVALTTILATILGSLFLGAMPKTSNIEGCVAGIKRLGDIARGLDSSWKVFERISNFVFQKVFEWKEGHPVSIEELNEFVSGVKEWFHEVQELSALNLNEKIAMEPETCEQIERLHAQGLRYSQMAAEFKLDRKMMEPFNVHWRLMQSMFDKATASGAFRSGPRVEPVVIYLFGESGVGKSGMTYPLAIELLKIDGITKVDGKPDFTRDIYMRNPEQEYWDNYRNQKICIYDDYAQAVDSVAKPNPEFFEIIRTGNLAPYPLHMASLEQKANTFFKSRVVICTSNTNIGRIRPASITCAEAVKRRVDVCMEVRVKPQFQMPGEGAFATQRLDPARVEAILGVKHSTDVYVFQPVDPLTGHAHGRPIDYNELVRRTSRLYEQRYARSQDIFQHLENIASAPRIAAQMEVHELKDKYDEYSSQCDLQLVRAAQIKRWPRTMLLAFLDNILDFQDILSPDLFEDLINMPVDRAIDIPTMMLNILENYDEIFVPDAPKIMHRWFTTQFDLFAPNLACMVLDVKPSSYSTIIVRNLRRQMNIFIAQCKEWIALIKEKIEAHPYITIGLMIIPAVIGMLGFYFNREKITLTNFKHHKLPRNKRVKHAHRCILCGEIFSHVHYIDEEANEYEICHKCKKNSLEIDMGDYVIYENQVTGSILAFKRSDLEENDVHSLLCANSLKLFNDVCEERKAFALVNPNDPTVKLAVEVASSGDINTRKKPLVRTELASSGDIHTRKRNVIAVELGKSGDVNTKKKPIIHTELEAEVATDPNSLAISKKVLNNMYNIDVLDGAVAVGRMKLTFLRGRVAITAGHLKPYLEKYSSVRIWNKSKPQGHIIPTRNLKIRPVVGQNGKEKDQILIEFPSVHDHADITGSIASSFEMSKFQTVPGCLLVPCDDGAVMKYGDIHAQDSVLYYEDAKMNNSLTIRERYQYTAFETVAGDCGSILMAVSSQLPRKILGLHVAGSYGLGVSSPFNISDIENAFLAFDMKAQISVSWDPLVTEHLFASECALPEGNFTAIGRVPQGMTRATKTELRPSKIHDIVTKHTTIPAALTPKRMNGKMVDPLELGLKKSGSIPPFADPGKIDIAIRDVERVINSNILPEHQKILTPFEAVTGIEGDPFMAAINRNTSPGYPFVFQRGNTPGKRKWLGYDDYHLDPELEQLILQRIELAKQNKRMPTVWTDTLKDERRPIEKVRALKTRAFSAGPMDYTLAFRMYFLGFAAHVAKNRIDNEISIGTNVYSDDWTRTALRLQKKGDHVIAGDFSNFDGTLLLQVLEPMVEIVNEFYDDGEENAMIRRVLWKEICNSVHLKGDQLYLWTHSQPSGCPVTAILNSMYNSITVRYVWLTVMPQEYGTMKAFNEHVSMVSYGDDNCLNISPEVIELFNQITIAEGYATIGMTYTDEAKSGEMVPYRTLGEIAYLKRTFTWNEEEKQYLAPLSMDTVLEMVNWVRGDLDQEQSTIDNIETSSFELSLHGRKTFEYWTRKYMAATKNFRMRPQILSYDEYRRVEAVKYGRLTACQF